MLATWVVSTYQAPNYYLGSEIFQESTLFNHMLWDIWWDSRVVAESHQVKQRSSVSDVTIPAFVAGNGNYIPR